MSAGMVRWIVILFDPAEADSGRAHVQSAGKTGAGSVKRRLSVGTSQALVKRDSSTSSDLLSDPKRLQTVRMNWEESREVDTCT